jgi:hypothetical protein
MDSDILVTGLFGGGIICVQRIVITGMAATKEGSNLDAYEGVDVEV